MAQVEELARPRLNSAKVLSRSYVTTPRRHVVEDLGLLGVAAVGGESKVGSWLHCLPPVPRSMTWTHSSHGFFIVESLLMCARHTSLSLRLWDPLRLVPDLCCKLPTSSVGEFFHYSQKSVPTPSITHLQICRPFFTGWFFSLRKIEAKSPLTLKGNI